MIIKTIYLSKKKYLLQYIITTQVGTIVLLIIPVVTITFPAVVFVGFCLLEDEDIPLKRSCNQKENRESSRQQQTHRFSLLYGAPIFVMLSLSMSETQSKSCFRAHFRGRGETTRQQGRWIRNNNEEKETIRSFYFRQSRSSIIDHSP